METIQLWDFQVDFLKDLLREYQTSPKPDIDTRLMAKDILDSITAQVPDRVYEVSLLTGELITFEN